MFAEHRLGLRSVGADAAQVGVADQANKSQLPKVSIIILNWNSYEVTRDCIDSITKIDYRSIEIVLVDNGSKDGSADRLAKEFPCLRVIRNTSNLGFPGGNNVGIRDALERNPDYLLLLNNDTIVAPDFLSILVNMAESDPQIGILNPKILFLEPSDRIWYAGGSYKPGWGVPKTFGINKRDDGRYNTCREVSFITGCAFLIKADVVRRIGLLDEIFFLGFEDVDWSVRALNEGFKAFYVPAAVIWHRHSFDTRKNLGKAVKDFYCMRNSILMARKHMRYPLLPLYLFSLLKYLTYHTAGYLVRAELNRVAALYKGIWSGCSTSLETKELVVTVAVPSKRESQRS